MMGMFLSTLGVLISIPICIGVFFISILLVLFIVEWVADFLFGLATEYKEDNDGKNH